MSKATNPAAHLFLNTFVRLAQAVVDRHMTENFPSLPREVLTVQKGRRYAKVIRNGSSQRYAFCFVDLTNGDVLKAASWKAPAMHARGNIFSANPVEGITPFGAAYLT